jgi:hypothetical protein
VSARSRIENIADCYLTPGVGQIVLINLDKYRDEVLREAAEKIRTEPPPADLDGRFGPYINAWLDGQSEAANLIDPDKENT